MTSVDVGPRRNDVFVSGSSAVLAIGLLLGLPLLSQAHAEGSTGVYPAPFSIEWILFALALLTQAAALLVTRGRPRITPVAVAVLAVAGCAVAPGDLHTVAELVVVVAVVLTAVRVPISRLWLPLSATAALVVVAEMIAGVLRADAPLASVFSRGILQTIGTVGLPLLIALVVRSRRDVQSARGAEAAAVGREQEALIDAAVSRERATMARELHDIAAHHLSGIALMAAVIDRQIDTEPERAHEGARQVREQSTAVLDDLRRLVGLLREDGPVECSVETVAGIIDLVERSRFRSEIRLDVRTEGDPGRVAAGVGPLAQLAAYRTAQEALANAALHAPGAHCIVTIDDRDSARVTVRIENGPAVAPVVAASAAGGNGLRGMRERANLVGASLQVSPTEDGGWQVELTLGREVSAMAAGSGPG